MNDSANPELIEQCHECDTPLAAGATFCANCGAVQHARRTTRTHDGAFGTLLAQLRARPKLAVGVAATAIAAVTAGAVLGSVLITARGVAAGDPTATATPSSEPARTADASPTLRPSPSVSETPSPTPTATVTPTPAETPASPMPTADPSSAPPEPDDGWESLPAMPNAESLRIADVLTLPDGRLVVFRFPEAGMYGGPWDVIAILPGDDAWHAVDVPADVTLDLGNTFTLAPSGLIYTHNWIIDPTTTPWTVEPFDIAPESDRADAFIPVGTGPDGRIYHAAVDDDWYLVAFDPETGEFTTSSRSTVAFQDAFSVEAILGGGDAVYLLDLGRIIAYDPATDTWSGTRFFDFTHPQTAGIGPDGRIYMMASDDQIYVWPGQGETLDTFPRPLEASGDWNPVFRTGPDGLLWAIDEDESFVFTGS